jgi:hypothetical protein
MKEHAMTEAEHWAAFRQWMAFAHPRGAEVVDHARERGCRLEDCAAITLDGPANMSGGYPIAYFGDLTGEYLVIQPERSGHYRPEPRGDGPEIDLAELRILDEDPKR